METNSNDHLSNKIGLDSENWRAFMEVGLQISAWFLKKVEDALTGTYGCVWTSIAPLLCLTVTQASKICGETLVDISQILNSIWGFRPA